MRRLVTSAFVRINMDGIMSFLLADLTAENGQILNAIKSLCDRVGQIEELLFEGNAIARMPSDEKQATIALSSQIYACPTMPSPPKTAE